MDVKTLVRSVGELSHLENMMAYSNVREMAITSPDVIRAYQTNPCLDNGRQPAEMMGAVGDKLIARVGTMPMPLWADGKEYVSSANPDILVLPEFRKSGFALDLLDFGMDSAKDKICIDFYVSRQARRVVKAYGGIVFDIRQFAVVRDSTLFFARRIPGGLAKVICPFLNVGFALHRLFVGAYVAWKTRGWKFVVADDEMSIKDFVRLVAADPHRFRPNATTSFCHWILKQDFNGIEKSNKHLWQVENDGELLGFVMARCDATNRGRIVDWQMVPGKWDLLPLMLMRAACVCLRACRAVVFSVSAADLELVRGLKRWLPQLPVQAATVRADNDSPLTRHDGWREQKNWRIRPTMGDSCLY